MRWGQGFFRIWLVLSALWIGLAVVLYEPKTYTHLWRSVGEVGWQGQQLELNLFKGREELSAEITAWYHEQRPDLDSAAVQRDREEILDGMLRGHRTSLAQAKTAWLLTVIPPIALFGFGLCIVWIARGFRTREGDAEGKAPSK
jgi:hypothetical protein